MQQTFETNRGVKKALGHRVFLTNKEMLLYWQDYYFPLYLYQWAGEEGLASKRPLWSAIQLINITKYTLKR